MSELKDCPHCGFKVTHIERYNDYGEVSKHTIVCENCDAKRVSIKKDIAFNLWNRRYDKDKLILIKTLLEANPDYQKWVNEHFKQELELIEEEGI